MDVSTTPQVGEANVDHDQRPCSGCQTQSTGGSFVKHRRNATAGAPFDAQIGQDVAKSQ
jgi:hypothetical protein